MTRTLCSVSLLVLSLATTASAQDPVVLAPPEMDAIVTADDRPPGADQLRLGFQLDIQTGITPLPFDFAGTAAYRPAPATAAGEGWRVRPEAHFRLRSPGKGTETQVAHRTVTSGGELELGLGPEATFDLVGVLAAYARWDTALMLHQASVRRSMPAVDEADRLLTAGLARTGPGAGLIVGPVLVGVDLLWHWVLFGAETFETFEETVTDGPRLGLSLVARVTSHLFVHFRILPSTSAVFPAQRWTAGVGLSFDPSTD